MIVALVALDALQLILDVLVDWIIRIFLGLLSVGVGIFLVNGPGAVRLAISEGLVSVLSSQVLFILAMRATPVAPSTNRAGPGKRASKSRALSTILAKRSTTLAAESVIEVMRSRTTRRARGLR